MSNITMPGLFFVMFCISLCLLGLAVGVRLGELSAAVEQAPPPVEAPSPDDPQDTIEQSGPDVPQINARNIETLRKLLQDHTGKTITFLADGRKVDDPARP